MEQQGGAMRDLIALLGDVVEFCAPQAWTEHEAGRLVNECNEWIAELELRERTEQALSAQLKELETAARNKIGSHLRRSLAGRER
jgi:hypothetical protein